MPPMMKAVGSPSQTLAQNFPVLLAPDHTQLCDWTILIFLQHVLFEGQKAKKRQDCVFWRQFNEKPGILPGCPGF